MHDFGMLIGRKETIKVPGFDGWPALDASGRPVLDEHEQPVLQGKTDSSSVDVLMFYDASGAEWHAAFRAQQTFDYYVGLDSESRVISMEEDPEHSQIAGLKIIGISSEEAGGFTRGPGGTVYGKQWLGTTLGEPVLTRAEYPDLTPRQLWLAAASINVSKEEVLGKVAQLSDQSQANELRIELTETLKFQRIDPAIDDFADLLHLPADQLDALWLWAARL